MALRQGMTQQHEAPLTYPIGERWEAGNPLRCGSHRY